MPSAALQATATDLIDRIKADPEWFAETILGIDLWPMQRRILRAITRPRAKVAVKACHASSKTYTAAIVVLWWLYSGGIVITTAPTWLQVEKLLWGEIHTLYERARFPLGGRLLKTELRLSADNYALGLSTNEGVRFQGWHGTVLLVLDEAPGVRPDIYEAIEGIRAGGDVRLLALGNPTISVGPFYDAFAKAQTGWHAFTIDAFDTPNLAGLDLAGLLALPDEALDDNPRPYLVSRRWVKERYYDWVGEYGDPEQSPIWQARVRGQFPKEDEHALIQLGWVEKAMIRWQLWAEAGRPGVGTISALGVDVGLNGDKTVFAPRHGRTIGALLRFGRADTMETAGRVKTLLDGGAGRATIDVIGIGAGVVHRLNEQGYGARVIGFNASAGSDLKDRSGLMGFVNKRAAGWWTLREALDPSGQDTVALPPDDRLKTDLVTPRWRVMSGGRAQVEAKDEIIKRLGRSPDDGDAVMMSLWNEPMTIIPPGVPFQGTARGW